MDEEMEYRGHTIAPKLDFGGRLFLIEGRVVERGFVVGKGHVGNIMPGATWFETVEQARHGIDCLIAADGDSAVFWRLVREERPSPAQQIEAMRARLADLMGRYCAREPYALLFEANTALTAATWCPPEHAAAWLTESQSKLDAAERLIETASRSVS